MPTDTTPPNIQNNLPPQGATGVAVTELVQFDLVDTGLTANSDELDLNFSDYFLFEDLSAQLGSGPPYTTSDGYEPVFFFAWLDGVAQSPSFTSPDAGSFTIPAGGAELRVLYLRQLRVLAPDIATIVVRVNGTVAFQNGAFAAGFSGTITPIFGGYRFTVAHPPFAFGRTQTISIDAQDLAVPPNMMMASWSFSTGSVASAPLELDMYRFIIEPIRQADLNAGGLFLQRYFQGPQTHWQALQDKILSLRDLINAVTCPDDLLQYLKRIVGWTPDLDSITTRLDVDALRRLIAGSVALWKRRGPETTIVNLLNVLMRADLRIVGWFDIRWIIGSTGITEEGGGADSWSGSVPSGVFEADNFFPLDGTSSVPTASDMQRMNVRIVDDGTLDHTLLVEVLKLMRPTGERFDVTYLLFLDDFLDRVRSTTKWTTAIATPPTFAAGLLSLSDSSKVERANAIQPGAAPWTGYSVFARVRGTGTLVLSAFYADDLNQYEATLDLVNSFIGLTRVTGGIAVNLATVTSLTTLSAFLYSAVWYGLRLLVEPEGSSNRLRVHVDGNLVIDYLDGAPLLTSGVVAVGHGVGGTIDVDEIEVMPVPTTTDTIDINP